MMKLDMEFRTRTTVGYTYCNVFERISDNYRDVDDVDFVIDKVKKLFGKNNFDPCITFRTETNTMGRIFEDWKDGKKGYTFLRFEKNEDVKYWSEKLTTAEIKCFYLNCIEMMAEKAA